MSSLNPIPYLSTLIRLRSRGRDNKKNRVMRHNLSADDVRHCGVLPFEHEWRFDCPSEVKSEDLLIYGVNSMKQSIKIVIKWRIDGNRTQNPINSCISIRYEDQSENPNVYTLEEESQVHYREREYKASGLTVEILSPFRKKRIRFRGYLTKNGKHLVYVRFRFLWNAISRVHDFTTDFNKKFTAKELTEFRNKLPELLFEDRLEQFGHMKGTFEEEQLPQKEIFLWGAIAKKFLEERPVDRRIIRILGYTTKGIGFEFGLVTHKNGPEYKYGILTERGFGFQKLKKIELNNEDFEELFVKKYTNIPFIAKFGQNKYQFNFLIEENGMCLAYDLLLNGNQGMCCILEENETEFQALIKLNEKMTEEEPLVLSLDDPKAKSADLCGGKGSSLAQLKSLSEQLYREDYANKFNVPNGIVVTTIAYKRLLEEYKDIRHEIEEFDKLYDLSREELMKRCDYLIKTIAKHELPDIIQREIKSKLRHNFDDLENNSFAVRSSAVIEDSDDMSAAGQMSTFLGVKGLENIFESVMKCWSSHFTRIAVEYKRSYGQPINSPMAVVIQEMVNCESAGVMFTCDPITGDERVIEITANYGLGESVVSGAADPDIIILSVDIQSNSFFKCKSVKAITKKTIGEKKRSIKLSESGGTLEMDLDLAYRNSCCISDDLFLRLGNTGLTIHRHSGSPRNIEWGIKEGKVFVLQSRPVTNLDTTYTDYEIMHEMDSAHRTEREIYSRAHWGEDFPGATSWTALGWFFADKSAVFKKLMKQGKAVESDYNPYMEMIGVLYNQVMFNLSSGPFDVLSEYPDTKQSEANVLAVFGHHIKDRDVLQALKEQRLPLKKPKIIVTFRTNCQLFNAILCGPRRLLKDKNDYMEKKQYDLVRQLKRCSNSNEMWDIILDNYKHTMDVGKRNHGEITTMASYKQEILKRTLKNAKDDNPNLDEDTNRLISSCGEVISAEVPNDLKDIAKFIEDKNRFLRLSDAEALKELMDGKERASTLFEKFLDKHGHRGYRELDPMHPTWRDDPTLCIKTIKGLLSGVESQLKSTDGKTVDQVMCELKTPIGFVRKHYMRRVLVPWNRSAVRYRQLSKYFMVWMNDKQRQGFKFLAQTMVGEGLIPSVNTFYYLTPTEVNDLCNGRRDPVLMMKVRLRRRLYPKMDKYKFDEFIKGPDMKPRNEEDVIINEKMIEGSARLTGTPVSVGAVTARVCVAEDIAEADSIESGDILITYSTDIGWSPYYPLLSGIITEIGGTVSHGVVIAREYRIPSMIGVEGACRVFRTGDICLLDTQTKTITKVG